MARLFWLRIMIVVLGALAVGGAWSAADTAGGKLLGTPPPQMGTQTTTLLWQGAPDLPGNPRAWLFAFGPTRIPGAPRVQIYVSPTGDIIRTEPADLAARLQAFHRPAY